MISREDQHPAGKVRIAGDHVQKFRPFGRKASIGHVPGDEYDVERPFRVGCLEASHHALETPIAARAAAATLDTKAKSLAHNVEIRKMGDTPHAAGRRRRVKHGQGGRLIHDRVRGAQTRDAAAK